MHHLLADAVKSRALGQIRNIAVHLAEHLDVLHYIMAISLQSAVEIMQITDAAHAPRRCIEEFRRQCLRQRVVAFLLISGHQIIMLFRNHTVELRNFIGRVLQVRIHRNHHITLCRGKATMQGRRLTVIAAELDTMYPPVFCSESLDHVPGTVSTAVIHKDYLIRIAVLCHDTRNPRIQLRQALGLIVQRNYNRNIHFLHSLFLT